MTTIVEDTKLDFSDVLLMPKRSTLDSRSKVDITRTFKFKHSPVEYSGTPIISANMDVTGTIKMAKAFKAFNMAVALHKFYKIEQLVQYFKSADRNPHTFYTMGVTSEDHQKFKTVQQQLEEYSPQAKLQYLCIDVANGYSRKFVNFVEKMRTENPDIVIMAGNVVTGDMVYDLLERGADIVKVGIGPGSVCTTRRITGVGYPQLSAILECQDAAHGADGLICGDGGIVMPGDLSKAFAAGSDFVMCGGIFAGHSECEGEIIGDLDHTVFTTKTESIMDWASIPQVRAIHTHNTTKEQVVTLHDSDFNHRPGRLIGDPPMYPTSFYKNPKDLKMRFYGMSSHEAMDKHYGGKANYKASEGKIVEVPYKGSVVVTIEEILGGIRSACTYLGARRLKALPKCATFVKVNRILNNSLSPYDI